MSDGAFYLFVYEFTIPCYGVFDVAAGFGTNFSIFWRLLIIISTDFCTHPHAHAGGSGGAAFPPGKFLGIF